MTMTTTTTLKAEQAIASLLFIREQEKAIEQAKKEAEATIVQLFNEMNIDCYESDSVRVAVEERPRRSFDMDILAKNLSATVLATLLKEAVDPSAFDSAVQCGIVPTIVAVEATKISYSTQVRVYGEKGVRGSRS